MCQSISAMKKKKTKFLLVWSLGERTAFENAHLRLQHIRRRLDTSGKLDGPEWLWDQETRDCDKRNQIVRLGLGRDLGLRIEGSLRILSSELCVQRRGGMRILLQLCCFSSRWPRCPESHSGYPAVPVREGGLPRLRRYRLCLRRMRRFHSLSRPRPSLAATSLEAPGAGSVSAAHHSILSIG